MNIAFASYETPFAPCGGIAAVMGRLPARVQTTSHLDTIVVTPFHHQIEKMASLGRSHEGTFGVDFEGRTVVCHVYRHDDKLPFYFILPEDRRFFAGRRHPYDVGGDELLRDALLFGASLPRALATINPGKRWTLLLQDWEAATAVLASAEAPGRPRAFVTLHNSYDANVTDGQLAALGFNPQACPGQTVLQRALALTELPIFTVSEQFAHDLCEDVLQTQVLAPHLQLTLKPRLVGIDNGPFVELAVDPQALAEAETGSFGALARWKAENRKAFLSALAGLKPSGDRPVWGDIRRFRQDDAPWFVMAGRDDSRQKGYDVATRAVELFLERNGDARFLFFPIPGDEGLTGLQFLRNLAEKFPQSVLAFPFLFREGFVGALRGATCGVMPSLYEPFGMANEFYLNGTVGIGRATGGIVQQICPLRAGSAFGAAVQSRADRWHGEAGAPTGFLFREPDGSPSEADDWRAINAARYDRHEEGLDRVQERSRYPLFQSMAAELHHALQDAARIASEEPQQYFRLLTAGISHIRRNFSWDQAALDYIKHIV
ncbi:MAG TPA: glycogen/starch synthase [Planctomycetaceae bacterium]|nr:glycogen/starch synthase [Planctomycetaceae bacterium]